MNELTQKCNEAYEEYRLLLRFKSPIRELFDAWQALKKQADETCVHYWIETIIETPPIPPTHIYSNWQWYNEPATKNVTACSRCGLLKTPVWHSTFGVLDDPDQPGLPI